jgi:hypothetical protein
MKNWSFVALTAVFIGLLAFQSHQAKKTYKVEGDINFWVQATNGLEFTKNNLKNSDLPSKTVTLITDSLLTPLQVEITKQVQAQINSENKKDTTKPKKN